jgi:hypothetical protein
MSKQTDTAKSKYEVIEGYDEGDYMLVEKDRYDIEVFAQGTRQECIDAAVHLGFTLRKVAQ